jgi:hypothetical protein
MRELSARKLGHFTHQDCSVSRSADSAKVPKLTNRTWLSSSNEKNLYWKIALP